MNIKVIKEYFKDLKINKTVLIYTFCISIFFCLPLILNNNLYWDDMRET